MGRLEKKVAIVTGAGRGIGAATLARFLDEGAAVLATDIDEQALADLAQVHEGRRVVTFAGDLGQPETPNSIVEAAINSFGALDIVVNNAGYISPGAIHRMSDEQFGDQLEIHVLAPFRLLRAAAPHLIASAKADAKEGREIFRKVVNVSSVLALSGAALSSNYGAAKAGIVGFTKSLAKEWGRYKINVNAVAFGLIGTRLAGEESGDTILSIGEKTVNLGNMADLTANSVDRIPLGRVGTPEEAAGAILVFCLPETNYVTGEVLVVSGGLR